MSYVYLALSSGQKLLKTFDVGPFRHDKNSSSGIFHLTLLAYLNSTMANEFILSK